MQEIHLEGDQVVSAAAIQGAVDALDGKGGRVYLPEMDLVLDRGLQMRSGVELVGQGEHTVLRMAPGRVYPLAGYHNYGMYDVPLEFTDGLEPGMTVAVRDNVHGGFFETFARITWIEDNWVGLDCALHADYVANQEPRLVTSFPLIYGLGVEDVAVRSLCLDGNRDQQPAGIGACRGAAVYFLRSRDFEVTDVVESDFPGEGLGFQMCSNVRILRCAFGRNAGNGYHPGAGSTAALFDGCVAHDNDRAGFFFCVRANHVTVRDCTFTGNDGSGISVGTRDCHNRVEDCRITDNGGPGILIRHTIRPVEVHSCLFSGCHIEKNARSSGRGQIDILGEAHDLGFEGNDIIGLLPDEERAGVYVGASPRNICLDNNRFTGCYPEIVADPSALSERPGSFDCGIEAAQKIHTRHLGCGKSAEA